MGVVQGDERDSSLESVWCGVRGSGDEKGVLGWLEPDHGEAVVGVVATVEMGSWEECGAILSNRQSVRKVW